MRFGNLRSVSVLLLAAPLLLAACAHHEPEATSGSTEATAKADQAMQTAQQALATAQKAEQDAQAANQRADQMYNRTLKK